MTTLYPCNYFTPLLITIFYPYNISPLFLPINMDMKRQISMCLFMFMIFILIEIKFDIDINNDGLLIIVWEHNKKENVTSSV
jgi:hypothetical protein